MSGVSRVLGDIYRASIPCSDEGSRSWSSVKACHLPGLLAKGGFEKLPGGHRGSRYDGEQGPGLVRGTCKEGRSISRVGAVASGPALPTLSRTIAKSLQTVEYTPNPSFPQKRESTVQTLESRSLQAVGCQSNNFAIVLRRYPGRLQSLSTQ